MYKVGEEIEMSYESATIWIIEKSGIDIEEYNNINAFVEDVRALPDEKENKKLRKVVPVIIRDGYLGKNIRVKKINTRSEGIKDTLSEDIKKAKNTNDIDELKSKLKGLEEDNAKRKPEEDVIRTLKKEIASKETEIIKEEKAKEDKSKEDKEERVEETNIKEISQSLQGEGRPYEEIIEVIEKQSPYTRGGQIALGKEIRDLVSKQVNQEQLVRSASVDTILSGRDSLSLSTLTNVRTGYALSQREIIPLLKEKGLIVRDGRVFKPEVEE